MNTYYNAEWLEPDKLHLQLDELTLDAIYDGYVRYAAGTQPNFWAYEIAVTTESL